MTRSFVREVIRLRLPPLSQPSSSLSSSLSPPRQWAAHVVNIGSVVGGGGGGVVFGSHVGDDDGFDGVGGGLPGQSVYAASKVQLMSSFCDFFNAL